MKKKIIGALISLTIIALAVVGWMIAKSHRSSIHDYKDVAKAIPLIAASTDSIIQEQRTSSSEIRATRSPKTDELFKSLTGIPLYNDKDEFILQDGAETIQIIVYHIEGKAASIRILPSGTSTNAAQSILNALKAKFPDIDYSLISP